MRYESAHDGGEAHWRCDQVRRQTSTDWPELSHRLQLHRVSVTSQPGGGRARWEIMRKNRDKNLGFTSHLQTRAGPSQSSRKLPNTETRVRSGVKSGDFPPPLRNWNCNIKLVGCPTSYLLPPSPYQQQDQDVIHDKAAHNTLNHKTRGFFSFQPADCPLMLMLSLSEV